MRKFINICIFFAMLCIFSGISTSECSAASTRKKECYISAAKHARVNHEVNHDEIGNSTNFIPTKIVVTIVKEYKRPVILPEFKNVDLEPDFRIQYPRRTTTEEEAFCK